MTVRTTPTLAIALLLALSTAACDADPDTGPEDDTVRPDTGAAPVDVPPPVPAPVPETSVPDRFHGRYAADVAACDSAGHVSELRIGADAIEFHESSGPVRTVSLAGDAVTITAELTGEGQTREATYRFGLSADGATLADLDGGTTRVRCPS